MGTYSIRIQQTGFKAYEETGVVLDVNSALVVAAKLQIGRSSEQVVVSSDALHVDTETTQMGKVITAKDLCSREF